MIGVDEQEKVRALLREAVTVLCRTGLPHCNELTVEGLLGITLNSQEVFLVNINERIKHGDDSMGVDTNLVPGVSPVHSRGKSARHRKRQRDREKDTRSPTSGGARKTAGEPNNKKTKAVDGPAPDEAGGESEDEHHSEDETETRIKREDDLDKNETEQTQNSPITTTASAGDTTKNKSEPSKDAAQESGSDGASEQGNNDVPSDNDVAEITLEPGSFHTESATFNPDNSLLVAPSGTFAGTQLGNIDWCPYCGKTFANPIALSEHSCTEGSKWHQCQICGKQLGTKEGLRRHMNKHTGNFKHKCDKCDKGFNRPYELKRHMLQKHAEKPGARNKDGADLQETDT